MARLGHSCLDIGETFRSQGGSVATAAARAAGGRIELHAGSLIHLIESELTTTVKGGGSDAGNIILDSPFVLLDQSLISANAFTGRGGNIRIEAGVFLADPASQVSASSELGIRGTVDIQAPVTTLSGTMAPLPQAFVKCRGAPARAVCGAPPAGVKPAVWSWAGAVASRFDPSGVLPSPLHMDERLIGWPCW